MIIWYVIDGDKAVRIRILCRSRVVLLFHSTSHPLSVNMTKKWHGASHKVYGDVVLDVPIRVQR